MMGKASQVKGRRGELELCHILKENGWHTMPGMPMSYGRTPDVTGLPGVHIECKRCERLNIHAAMRQSQRDAKRFHDGAPTVFHRRNGEEWLVTMNLSDWLKMYKKSSMDSSKRSE